MNWRLYSVVLALGAAACARRPAPAPIAVHPDFPRLAARFAAIARERGIALVRHRVAEWARGGGFSPPPVV